MKTFIKALAFICIAVSQSLPAWSQDVRPLPPEEVLGRRSFFEFSRVAFSPDGGSLAFTIAERRAAATVGMETHVSWAPTIAGGTDIYVLNVTTGEMKNLTGGKGGSWQAVWSPDGHYLAFLSDRDGSGQEKMWVWDIMQKQFKIVSDLDVQGKEIVWTRDSRSLMITVLPEGLTQEISGERMSSGTERQNKEQSKTSRSTVNVYRSKSLSSNDKVTSRSDPWNLDGYLRDLAMVDIGSGKVHRLVRRQRIAEYLLSPDGLRIAYTRPTRFEKPGSQQILFDLVGVNLATDEKRVIASDIRLDFDGAAFSWSPDGRRLAYQLGGMEAPINDCYIVDLNAPIPHKVTSLPAHERTGDKSSAPPLWDVTGREVYFILEGRLWRSRVDQDQASELAEVPNQKISELVSLSDSIMWTTDGGQSATVLTHDDKGSHDEFYKIDLRTGRWTKLLGGGQQQRYAGGAHRRTAVAVSKNGQQVAYFAEDAQHDIDLWSVASDFRNPRRLTHLNPQFDNYRMGTVRLVDWLSDDGERLEGALLLPANYQEGRRCPLVVWLYGGASLSHWHWINQFGLAGPGLFNMQLLATRGYAVLLPDAPQRLGTPMLDLAKTVLPGVNKIIEMGVADPDRVGVMGHSYGGYSTLSLLVQTRRFKAAVEVDGYGDLIGSYGEMNKDGTSYELDIQEQGQGLMGGTPWQYRDRYIENSPLFFLDRIETPLLIAHGGEDSAIAPFLGDQIFVGLRRLGKEVDYAKYNGEGHDPNYWSYANQVDFCNRMIAWFEKYLKPEQLPN